MATIPTTLEESLTILVAKWQDPFATQANGVLQYRIVGPGPTDVAGVYVDFTNGTPTATIGTHESPDLLVTIPNDMYFQYAADEVHLGPYLAKRTITIQPLNPNGLVLLRQLGQSYRKRP